MKACIYCNSNPELSWLCWCKGYKMLINDMDIDWEPEDMIWYPDCDKCGKQVKDLKPAGFDMVRDKILEWEYAWCENESMVHQVPSKWSYIEEPYWLCEKCK